MTKGQEFLLHLLAHNREFNNYIVSESLTAKGISKTLNCSIGHTYYLINKFEREGLITCSKANIILGKRKQETMFLTEDGLKLTKELDANINKLHKKRNKMSD